MKTVIASGASISSSSMVAHSLPTKNKPPKLQRYLLNKFATLVTSFSTHVTFIIEEYEGLDLNQLFEAAKLHLATLIPSNMHIFGDSFPVGVAIEITDRYCGVELIWKYSTKKIRTEYDSDPEDNGSKKKTESRYFELTFNKKYKDFVVETYLRFYLLKSYKRLKKYDKKTIKLYSLKHDRRFNGKPWTSVKLDHPVNFDTLVMDSEMKNTIMYDLEWLENTEEKYRGLNYLLFGPPGTGKSSLIAAMANYLNYDIYDLQLSSFKHISDLNKPLAATKKRSILVVEDIVSQIPLSKLIERLCSFWGADGQIVVFATNHKERLDPAFLSDVSMDMHIHMSYCTPSGFNQLASNYLGITDHPLFLKVEELLETTKATPAEVGRQLMINAIPEVALTGLIEFLRVKKETEEAKAGEVVALKSIASKR